MSRSDLFVAIYLALFGYVLSDFIITSNRCLSNMCSCTESNPMKVTCTEQFVSPSPFMSEIEQLVDWPYRYQLMFQANNFPVIERIVSENKTLVVLTLTMGRNQINTLGDRIFDNIHGLRELKLSVNNLASLSFLRNKMVSNLTLLDASQNKLTEFRPEWVEFMESLQELRLDNNKIKSIESGIFDRMVDLVTITLNSNELVVIPRYLFNGLSKLVYLNLEDNLLSTIEAYAFNGCVSLKMDYKDGYVMLLKAQSLEILESYSFADLKQVTNLHLYNNNLFFIPNMTFFGMEQLLSLRLDYNYIEFVDVDGFDASLSRNLFLLNLSSNSLVQVNRSDFAHLKSLNYLYLDTNYISKIEPYSFENQSSALQVLDIHSNKIGDIKEHHISYLDSLVKLNLSYNQISTIEINTFRRMKNLKELDLTTNCIFKIHYDLFTGLTSLTYLSLSDNLFHDLNATTFNSQTNLVTLDLSYNSLREIPSSLFSYLKKLKTLYLNNNQLSWLNNSKSFAGLSSLTTLKLSGNMIRQLTASSFTGISLGALKSLYLDNNLIDSTQSSRIPFNSLSLLDLSSNPFIKGSNILPTSYSSALELSLKNMTVEFVRSFWANIRPYIVYKLDLSFTNLREANSDINLIKFYYLNTLILRRSRMNLSTALLPSGNMDELDLTDNPDIIYAPNFQSGSYYSLTKLKLANTSLQDVEILNLDSFSILSYVDLSRNRIEIIKTTYFHKMTNLKSLNLSSNGIKLIEPRFIGPREFDMLDLSNNMIEYIKGDFFTFFSSKSVSMYLSNNRIRYFGYNSSILDRIDLSMNELDQILDEKNRFILKQEPDISLKYLNLTMNKISYLKNDSFLDNKYLEYIYLASNNISYIQDYTFSPLSKLKALDLSNNSISEVSSNTFKGLVRLVYLNVSKNSIQYLESGTFDSVKALTTLDLNYNQIKQISDYLFSPLGYLRQLFINQIQMNNISSVTFEGLFSVVQMEANKYLFIDSDSVNALIYSLDFRSVKKNNDQEWYYAVYIFYKEGIEYSDRYCSLIIYFARNNLLFNMDIDSFMQNCRHKDITDLEYHKVGLAEQP